MASIVNSVQFKRASRTDSPLEGAIVVVACKLVTKNYLWAADVSTISMETKSFAQY